MKTFKGGIHPPENKVLVKDNAIIELPLSKVFFVPTQQHLGAPAEPVVNTGDTVKRGQVLTESMGFVSAVVHAPTSGTVREITKRVHPVTGLLAPYIIIEADGKDCLLYTSPSPRDS